MLKYVVAMVCGVSLTGSVYMAGWGSAKSSAMCGDGGDCCAPVSRVAMMDAKAATPAGIDVKNTKCIVSGDDIGVGTGLVSYKGKLYHICCDDCTAPFNKDPEKYIKALEADPAKFGVKQ